jgi:hypothetical protein
MMVKLCTEERRSGCGMDEPPEQREGEEADRLFDATVRRMLTTPPKPHEDMKLGKPRRKPARARREGEDDGQQADEQRR